MSKYPNRELGNKPKDNFIVEGGEPQNPPVQEASPDLNKRAPFTKLEKEELAGQVFSMLPEIQRYVFSRLGRRYPTEVDNVVGDVLKKTSEKIDRLKDKLKLEAWVWRITKNLVVDFVRDKRNKLLRQALSLTPAPELEAEIFEPPDPKADPERALLIKERDEALKRAVDKLPPEYRQPVILYHYEELSVEEISEILGIGIDTVKTRLDRGRKLLLSKLSVEKFRKTKLY